MTIIMIAVGLSMDAFAVSIVCGCLDKSLKIPGALRIAIFFGLFQALMPVLGWSVGVRVAELIANYDHWVAFVLLGAVGGKMIWESTHGSDETKKTIRPEKLRVLLTLSLATSIDALVVGFSLSFLKITIAWPALMIGLVTFLFSFFGVYLGKKTGHLWISKLRFPHPRAVGNFVPAGADFFE